MSAVITITHEGYKYEYGTGNRPTDLTPVSRLSMAKNDWAAFQVIVSSEERAALSLSGARLFSKYGKIPFYRIAVDCDCPGVNVSVKAVGLMRDDDGQLKSDVLLGSEFLELEPRRAQPVWIELTSYKETVPGNYHCRVRIFCRPATAESVFEDEELYREITLPLTVHSYRMPSPSEYRMHLNLWQHPASIAQKHEVPLWSDRHFEILEGYTESLARLGQKCVSVTVSEAPWSGQFCYITAQNRSDLFSYSMISIVKKTDGNYDYDFSVADRYIALCEKYGIRDRIELFGLVGIWDGYNRWVEDPQGFGGVADDYPDSIRLRYMDESTSTYRFIRDREGIKSYIRAVYAHYLDKKDRIRVSADEPADFERFCESIEIIRECAPEFQLGAAINHIEFIDKLGDRLSDITPILPFAAQKLDSLKKAKERYGTCISAYVCCGPDFPNNFLRSPAAESRVQGILTYMMGLDGFLRWDYTVWTDNPRADIRYRAPGWKAGDTCFVYPGNDGTPLLSLRWKHLKRGIEDFELLSRAEEKAGRNVVEKLYRSVIYMERFEEIDTEDSRKRAEELYSVKYEEYAALRESLLEILEGEN